MAGKVVSSKVPGSRNPLWSAGRVYVIARSGSGRPTLQHRLPEGVASLTACGTDISMWSRSFQNFRIEEVLCRRAACRE